MCGRYTNHLSWTEIVELYELANTGPAQNFPVRLNIAAPTGSGHPPRTRSSQRFRAAARYWLRTGKGTCIACRLRTSERRWRRPVTMLRSWATTRRFAAWP